MIYFIQAVTGGPIKIGFALDPDIRLRGVQCGNPEEVVILKTIPGSRQDEARIHRELAAHHKRGEWFYNTAEVLAYIRTAGAYEYELLNGKPYLALHRKAENEPTETCPFCSQAHRHGIGDGHRIAHCARVISAELCIGDVRVYHADGYVIRTLDAG